MDTLKERIKAAFPGAEFDRHETDLYVKNVPGLLEWLKANYEHYSNIQRFKSAIDGSSWLDISFCSVERKI